MSRPSNFQLLLNNRLAMAGAILLSVIAVVALAAPLLPLPPPDATDPAQRLLPPLSPGHLLGTDHLGRDLLSRLIWGTRVSLAVGVAATLVAALIGSTLGLIAGFSGGRSDDILMRGVDLLMAFPYVLLALAIVAAFGPGLLNALYAIAIVNIPFFARAIRGAALGLSKREFVAAGRLAGRSRAGLLLFEVLPNVLPIIVITMSTTLGWMILETAGLSFLGLGAQPPQADLGSMLGEGRKLLITAPHVTVVPGLMIFLVVMAVNLLGDGIRDILDPQLRSGALTRPSAMTTIDRPPEGEATAPALQGLLTVDRLSTQFHSGATVYRAVESVSLSLEEGECLGLVGESGSGKSVTALSLLGLVASPPGKIVAGQVRFEGQDLLALSLPRLQQIRGGRIAYVFQDPLTTLHPLFSIGDQIVEGIRAHRAISYKAAWREAVALLEQVRIPNAKERAHHLPHQLSGGMRQRVSIALALANDPAVIIADEPTTALDVTVQAQILKLLDALRRERQMALLFISHDFALVSTLCERVAVMYAGQIVEIGPTETLLNYPAHPYTHRLLACVPRLGAKAELPEAIPGLPPPADKLPPGCAFAPRCQRATDACRQGVITLDPMQTGQLARCIHPMVATP